MNLEDEQKKANKQRSDFTTFPMPGFTYGGHQKTIGNGSMKSIRVGWRSLRTNSRKAAITNLVKTPENL